MTSTTTITSTRKQRKHSSDRAKVTQLTKDLGDDDVHRYQCMLNEGDSNVYIAFYC